MTIGGTGRTQIQVLCLCSVMRLYLAWQTLLDV